jgi:hypothetical protein
MTLRPASGGAWCRAARFASLGIVASVTFATSAQAQFSVSPVIVEFPTNEAPQVVTVTIHNSASDVKQFRAYAVDYEANEQGQYTYFDPGEHPSGCGDRITVTPDGFSIPANESKTFTVRMEPGDDARTCWSMVFVESPAPSGTGIRITTRIGMAIFGLSGSGSKEGKFIDAMVVESDSARVVNFTFENLGAWPLRPDGTVEIRTVDGETVAKAEIIDFGVLPGHRRNMTIEVLEELPPGRYVAIPILDFGGDYLAGTQVEFRVPSG